MCGRYALGIRAAFVRHQFQQQNMPVDEAPEDDETRETYNFAPGYFGLVYRADVPDQGAGRQGDDTTAGPENAGNENESSQPPPSSEETGAETRYKLQAMKWGLVPFWTKRSPDYGTVMKTINARDDSLAENRGMWTSMKKKKRCIVVAQGFYEWLKKNNGKEKIPHFMKRPDDKVMCFAGLWDSVKYEGSDEKHFTYTIITTDVNKQLSFLHDRMPVILENGSEDIWTWLDPKRTEWTSELQSLLKPFEGQLECYPVSRDVGKVGNNSPDFIVPVASTQNKKNIANFFANAKKPSGKAESESPQKSQPQGKLSVASREEASNGPPKSKIQPGGNKESTEAEPEDGILKRKRDDEAHPQSPHKTPKTEAKASDHVGTPSKPSPSPQKTAAQKKLRSATSNGNMSKGSPVKSDGSQKITSFFGK